MPGGNPYPSLIAETPRKPLRVFLQAGHRDLGWDEPEDNWLAENLRVAAALAEAATTSASSSATAVTTPTTRRRAAPDALRWVFRPESADPVDA